jgi:hypothetical protein
MIISKNNLFYFILESKNVQPEEENDIMLEPAAGVSFTINNSTRVGPKKVIT